MHYPTPGTLFMCWTVLGTTLDGEKASAMEFEGKHTYFTLEQCNRLFSNRDFVRRCRG